MTAPRLSVCLTFDFDALSPWAHQMANGNMAAMSRGEFGVVAIPRILALLERHDVPASFFIPGHTALAYPDVVRSIRDAGHEIGHHGCVHEPLSELTPAREREIMLRGLEALDRVPACDRSATGRRTSTSASTPWTSSSSTGSATTPRSRAPTSSRTTCAAETVPARRRVRLRRDDRPRRDPVLAGGSATSSTSSSSPGITVRQDPPSAVYEIWHGELDWAHANVPGGVFDLTMHPQAIGRGHRLVMVERLIEAAKGLDGVVFERLGDYAARWREQNPLGRVAGAGTGARAPSAGLARASRRLASVSGETFDLHARGPYSLAASARFLEGFAPAAQAPATSDHTHWAFAADDGVSHVGVCLLARGDGAALTVFGGHGAAVRDQVERILSLDADGAAFAEVGDRDPVVGRLQAAPGRAAARALLHAVRSRRLGGDQPPRAPAAGCGGKAAAAAGTRRRDRDPRRAAVRVPVARARARVRGASRASRTQARTPAGGGRSGRERASRCRAAPRAAGGRGDRRAQDAAGHRRLLRAARPHPRCRLRPTSCRLRSRGCCGRWPSPTASSRPRRRTWSGSPSRGGRFAAGSRSS